jgi:hypothetical protein
MDLAIFVEVHLIDRLKLFPLELALKDKQVPVVLCDHIIIYMRPIPVAQKFAEAIMQRL